MIASGCFAGSSSAAEPEWLDLSWDDCASGVSNKAFTCDSNVGVETIVVSFASTINFPKVVRVEVSMHVCFEDNILPDWWTVLRPSGCRWGALTGTIAPPSVGCASIWDAAGGVTLNLGEIDGTPTTLNGFRFVLDASIGDSSRALDIRAGQTYELMRMTLDHTRTVGTGACGGCSIGASIGGDFVWLFGATNLSNMGFSQTPSITWQVATTNCVAITPVRRQTWGALKALYR